MDRLTQIATSYYEIAKDYKDFFCKLKNTNKLENKELTGKAGMQKYLIGFYNSHQLYNFVKENKEISVDEIKKALCENYGILRLYNLIESNISSTEDLDNIDVIYKFLYDTMTLEECCDIAIKKYGSKYKKYCNLYIRMQKVEKDLLDYLKELYEIN